MTLTKSSKLTFSPASQSASELVAVIDELVWIPIIHRLISVSTCDYLASVVVVDQNGPVAVLDIFDGADT
jgi:hypothetical protein